VINYLYIFKENDDKNRVTTTTTARGVTPILNEI